VTSQGPADDAGDAWKRIITFFAQTLKTSLGRRQKAAVPR